ncbi:uncharacterized protein LOC119986926 [Tripterygium wilfordii]|uniref:uncharacterized protein LOC119986926 n=1 Tax=Tripterygium wilfordii TaxID=458696 RepID=UPI0018F81CC9|nr:uncharacterized protein LOC119986926 [Tripterygium wilfordii]
MQKVPIAVSTYMMHNKQEKSELPAWCSPRRNWSLWNLRQFRDEFLRRSAAEHVHVGDPCVVCALYDIFTVLSTASADTQREPVVPTSLSLRIALSNFCGMESRHLKYTSFFHNINASALRTMKVMFPRSSFDELLNFVEMHHQLACDSESGGCGQTQPNHIHHFLSKPPYVFTTALNKVLKSGSVLEPENPSVHDLNGKSGSKPDSTGLLYLFIYLILSDHEHEKWIMYDDKTVKVVVGWTNVLTVCQRGHLQPQGLFFEAVHEK